MSDNAIIPAAPPVAADVTIREATLDDVPFIDQLQKLHREGVGFMHRGTLEGKIKAREVLVAVIGHGSTELAEVSSLVIRGVTSGVKGPASDKGQVTNDIPVGYVIGTDRYFKHDDVGIIYHLNVSPGAQRGFVGATLLKAMFDRAAYGCRLFCCWCAQDIEANRFWEAMGFVPLAYRAGSEKKSRVHIFWQKRIRAGDVTTPWWFPSQTTGGAIREDRLVLPIPPGTHWSDVKPIVLPALSSAEGPGMAANADAPKALPAPPRKARERTPVVAKRMPLTGGLCFAPPTPPPTTPKGAKKPRACPERSRGEKNSKRKNDPRLVAAARELKDRWLEHINKGGALIEASGKYDVTRVLSANAARAMAALPAAA